MTQAIQEAPNNGKIRFPAPNDMEPEWSGFPDPEKCDAHSLLKAFPAHMGTILKSPQKSERRRFREYAISFSLDRYDGNDTPYNFRMRAFLQPAPDGSVTFTNMQFTVKTKGNGTSRKEYETSDNLPTADIEQAFNALKRKYGSKLPQEITNINPAQFYVDALCINARIGKNGIHKHGNNLIPEYSALTMYNSDFVLFTIPEILDKNGKLINLGPRLETEIELKNIQTDPAAMQNLSRLCGSEDRALSSLFLASLDQLKAHAETLITHRTPYETGKVDEARVRAQPHLETIQYDWRTASEKRGRVPSDYLAQEMQPALQALIQAVPSPYGKHDKEMQIRNDLFNNMRQNDQRETPYKGYGLALLEAA